MLTIEKIREEIPNHGMHWPSKHLRELKKASAKGASVEELAEEFGRSKNAIHAALGCYEMIEPVEELRKKVLTNSYYTT